MALKIPKDSVGPVKMREGTTALTEFLKFEITKKNRKKTFDVIVRNKKSSEHLGDIFFYGAWRKYVFAPEVGMIFDSKCLADINMILNRLTGEWREGLKK